VWLLLQLTVAAALAAGQPLTISAQALRHPISRKGSQALKKVMDLYLAGDEAAMHQQLRRAMELADAAPYALKMKGLLDLNRKDFPAAQNELQRASAALPWDSEAEALLAYSIYCGGDSAAGAATAYKALEIDRNQPLAHMVIGLAQWEVHCLDSGLQQLQTAASFGLLPAQILLASYYARSGQTELAQQEWRLTERDLNRIQDHRVRQDAERWLEKHRAFNPGFLQSSTK